jgi:hypothetical protein
MREPRSFIVRICRRGFSSLEGFIEDPQGLVEYRFASMDELWAVLRRACIDRKRKRIRYENTTVANRDGVCPDP